MKRSFAHSLLGEGAGEQRRILCLETANKLSYSELCLLLQDIERIKASQAWQITNELFTTGIEIVRKHIVPRMAVSWKFDQIRAMRLVSTQWLELIEEVTHLNFARNTYWSSSIYEAFLRDTFTCVTTIHSHQRILSGMPEPSFGRITTLVIDCDNEDAEYPALNISAWTNLQCLIFNDTPDLLVGLSSLTTLTHLEVSGIATEDPSDIEGLTNLRHLCLFEMERTFDRSKLTKLEYLESDCGHFFIGFTGEGALRINSVEPNSEFEDGKGIAMYEPGCSWCNLEGHWKDGLFTGYGSVQYGETEDYYWGNYLDGKRHGEGTEYDKTELLQYIGEWRHGHRHGTGQCYRVTKEDRWSFDKRKPTYTQEWSHGTLLGETIHFYGDSETADDLKKDDS